MVFVNSYALLLYLTLLLVNTVLPYGYGANAHLEFACIHYLTDTRLSYFPLPLAYWRDWLAIAECASSSSLVKAPVALVTSIFPDFFVFLSLCSFIEYR